MGKGWGFAWGSKTFVMGIVNATPDSFSGDGVGDDVEAAAAAALSQVEAGADIVDVGGESTRPGSTPVALPDELQRVIPAIRAIRGRSAIPISVDTSKAPVAEAAVEAGAGVVNDVSGLQADPGMIQVLSACHAGVVLMHSRAERKRTDIVEEVVDFLHQASERAMKAGISGDRIVVDPGFGFAKDASENLIILRRLPELRALGFPVLVGASRKSTIGRVLALPVGDRMEGSVAVMVVAIVGGADMVRVHDVQTSARAAKMTDAVVRGWEPDETG